MSIKAHLRLDCCLTIFDKVETVCHLSGLRCTLTGGLRIEAAPISADDFYVWPFLQPCFHACDAAIIRNIDDRSFFEINHDGAVVR